VLALRLYSSPVYKTVTKPLHDGCSPERPHPYPALVCNLIDALARLRQAQGEQRDADRVAAEKAMSASVDEDDEEAAAAVAAAKEQYALLTEDRVFWRGVYGLNASEFKARGGTEIAFFSTSTERVVAQQAALEHADAAAKLLAQPSGRITGRTSGRPELTRQSTGSLTRQSSMSSFAVPVAVSQAAAPSGPPEEPILLFKLRLGPESGAFPSDISDFSLTPAEKEWVFPPGVYLEQKKEHTETIDGGVPGSGSDQCKIVECAPYLPSVRRASVAAAPVRRMSLHGAGGGLPGLS